MQQKDIRLSSAWQPVLDKGTTPGEGQSPAQETESAVASKPLFLKNKGNGAHEH